MIEIEEQRLTRRDSKRRRQLYGRKSWTKIVRDIGYTPEPDQRFAVAPIDRQSGYSIRDEQKSMVQSRHDPP
jgi:hypothetical protein